MRKLEEDDCLEVAESVVKPKSKRQTTPKTGDDDLTSLSWLQDKNLLKGIHLHTPVVAPDPEVSPNKAEPKEPEVKDSLTVDIEASACPGVANPPNASANTSASVNLKHPFNVPYDPQVHVASKPPFSFSCLIFMSIEGSPRKALPVKDIYNWIVQHFPYYRDAPNGWKNSVRHNLSLNKCFRKVEKAPNVGKGSLWMVDAHFRPNLLHALEKAPYSFSRALKCTTGEDALISHHSPTSDDIDDELSSEEVSEELNDVGAAAAMMVLKHGPRASELYPSLSSRKKKSPVKKSKLTELNSPNTSTKLVPIQIKEELEYKQDKEDSDYDAYADEAYAADEESNSSLIVPKYSEEKSMKDEERRKIEEGADALLNLAGITTSFTKNNNNYNFINNNSDSRLIFKSHSNSIQHSTNGNEEENYKPRFIRRNHSHTKTSLKRKDISSNKVDNQKIQLSEKYDKPNKGKKIKLVKKNEKSKR